MTLLRGLAFAVAVTLIGGAADSAPHSPRQYYSSWNKHPTRAYSYRQYFYKPSPTFAGYKHHYVISYRARPKFLYFFNPYKKVFWGRCPSDHGGKPKYSLLAEKDRKGQISEIPEEAFPEPGALPPVPEATDDATLDLPPDDLPPDGQPPATLPN